MKILKVLSLVMGILLLLLGAGAAFLFYKARNIKDTGDLEAQVDRAVHRAMQEHRIPGIGVVVLADRSNAEAVDGLGLQLLLQAHSISFGQ